MLAAWNGHDQIVEVLLEKGASVNLYDEVQEQSSTADVPMLPHQPISRPGVLSLLLFSFPLAVKLFISPVEFVYVGQRRR